jgi:hypothetical protein
MIRLIKYKLFMWLWNDICRNSECDDCMLDGKGCSCLEMEIRLVNQAKMAWIIK